MQITGDHEVKQQQKDDVDHGHDIFGTPFVRGTHVPAADRTKFSRFGI
jgi:hypothetical protein